MTYLTTGIGSNGYASREPTRRSMQLANAAAGASMSFPTCHRLQSPTSGHISNYKKGRA